LRPVDPKLAAEVTSQLPRVEDLWTIEYLGGWNSVATNIYGPEGVYSKVVADLRGSR
jgi:ABC-type sulfate transport system substrate-binding protein